MPLKILLLNMSKTDVEKVPGNVMLTESTIEKAPTLHDFHVILMDMENLFNPNYWPHDRLGQIVSQAHTYDSLRKVSDRVNEQIVTGGVVFCFSSTLRTKLIGLPRGGKQCAFDNHWFIPVDLGIVSDKGDTFYPKTEELKYFAPLIKKILKQDIDWTCYFSKIPEKARVIGVNRAGYAVFLEVQIGSGRLVMLPHFKNRYQAATLIVNEIVPRMIHEEDFTFVPGWLDTFTTPFEKSIRESVSEIEKAKRLLYTKDQALEKAVAFAFDRIGFKVEMLPNGTLPDIRLSDGDQLLVVEVKGHENKQGSRDDALQLLGYMSETNVNEKGVVVINHQFNEEPSKRDTKAFTDGAIQLGEKNEFSLISSVELSEVIMKVLDKKLDSSALKEIREKIINGKGIVRLLRDQR